MKLPIAFLSLLSLAALACGGDGAVNITSPAGAPALTVAGNPGALSPGGTANLTALLVGPNNRVITDGTVLWSSSDTSIVRIAPTSQRTATMTAVREGVAEITAAIAGVSARANAAVTLPRAFIYSEQDGMSFIPTPTGSSQLAPAAINDAGQVIGSIQYGIASNTFLSHAFLWSRAGGLTDLDGRKPEVNSGGSWATAISQNGQVTGGINRGTGSAAVTQAFKWTLAGGMMDLGVPPGASYSSGTGINSSGDVVGYAEDIYLLPFRFLNNGSMAYLGNFADYVPTAINDAGQITVSLTNPYDDGYRGAGLLSASGVKTDIIVCNYCGAAALAINGNGVVAGTDGRRAFTWTATGGFTLVTGIPADVFYSEARGINDKGTVIGIVRRTNGERSFISSPAGGYREIPLAANQRSLSVTGINNKDQVVGVVQ